MVLLWKCSQPEVLLVKVLLAPAHVFKLHLNVTKIIKDNGYDDNDDYNDDEGDDDNDDDDDDDDNNNDDNDDDDDVGDDDGDNDDDDYDDNDDDDHEPAHPPAPAQHSVALSSQQFEQTQRPRAGTKTLLSAIFWFYLI